MPEAIQFEWNGLHLHLLADRAVWWPEQQALLLADLHLGKPEHFRAGGAPVPESVTRHDFDRLSALIGRFAPARLIVLGDLLHARCTSDGPTLRQLTEWRTRHADLAIILLAGNHDKKAGRLPVELAIDDTATAATLGGLSLTHDPCDARSGEPTLCGHVHPAVRLRAQRPTRTRSRAACFHFTQFVGTLPAFGSFTGAHTITPDPTDRIFAVNDDQVVEIPTAAAMQHRHRARLRNQSA